MERPRLQYLKQVDRNIEADGYTAMKRMACNNPRLKAANQSKDWEIRRRRKKERKKERKKRKQERKKEKRKKDRKEK